MSSTLAQNVFQIGFVVPDIHKGMAFFKDKFGVSEFLFIEKPELQDETIRNRRGFTWLSAGTAKPRSSSFSPSRASAPIRNFSTTIRRPAGTITASQYPTTVRACGTWRRADLR